MEKPKMEVQTDGAHGVQRRSPPAHERHLLHFFEKDDFAGGCVAAYLETGLIAGARILILAVPDHAREIVTTLESRGWNDVGKDRILAIDAREVLSRILAGGMPDPERFRSVIGESVPQGSRTPVRVYGEMADLLHLSGNVAAALALEDLWDTLMRERPVDLLCGATIETFLEQSASDQVFDLVRRHADAYPVSGRAG